MSGTPSSSAAAGASSSSPLWSALSSTALISVAPNLLLLVFPDFGNASNTGAALILSMGQSLAAGSLIGDVFLHTLPEIDGGMSVLLGFFLFLLLDMIVRAQETDDDHNHTGRTDSDEKTLTKNTSDQDNVDKTTVSTTATPLWSSGILLNLTADALHNFTDGLAVGVSHASGDGTVATVSILLHEIPHELGDYAVLLQQGWSKWQAIGAQFVTAVAAFLGTVVGVWAAQTWTGLLEPVTAGGFLYIATVSILPDVLEQRPKRRSGAMKLFLFRLAQVVAFLVGVGCLYGVHLLEDQDGHGHHHHHGHHAHAHAHHHHHGHDDHVHAHHHHDHHHGGHGEL